MHPIFRDSWHFSFGLFIYLMISNVSQQWKGARKVTRTLDEIPLSVKKKKSLNLISTKCILVPSITMLFAFILPSVGWKHTCTGVEFSGRGNRVQGLKSPGGPQNGTSSRKIPRRLPLCSAFIQYSCYTRPTVNFQFLHQVYYANDCMKLLS